MRRLALLIPLAACAATPLPAATPERNQPVCAKPAPVPIAYDGWGDARAVISASGPEGLAKASLAVGHGTELRLHPDEVVTFFTLPKAAGEPGSFGGMTQVKIAHAGTYRVALGDFVWVDLVRDGQPTKTASFGHGPDCTPIRKVVDFALQPGSYTLEVSGVAAQAVRLMILLAPLQR